MFGAISQRRSGRTAPQAPMATVALQPPEGTHFPSISHTSQVSPLPKNKSRALKFLPESTSEGAQSKTTVITEQRLDRHVRREQQSALRRGDEAAPRRPDFVALRFQNSIFSHVDHECSVGLR